MSKKYQLSPIELVKWADPALGVGKAAKGFTEKSIAEYESAVGIKIPNALREYYLAVGKADTNYRADEMLIPKKAKKIKPDNVVFSYDLIESELDWLAKEDKVGDEEQEKLRSLPVEQWGEVVGNYWLFWAENQGCWYAGIKVEDLDKPNPPVYYNDNDDMYHWAPFGDSIESFILSTVIGNIDWNCDVIKTKQEIEAILEENDIDFECLTKPYPFPGGRFAHTCLDTDTNTLYVYGEEAENREPYLKIITADEDNE